MADQINKRYGAIPHTHSGSPAAALFIPTALPGIVDFLSYLQPNNNKKNKSGEQQISMNWFISLSCSGALLVQWVLCNRGNRKSMNGL